MDSDDTELLQGGVNQVRRSGAVVRRPGGSHSPTVLRFLTHLHEHGFDFAPQALGFDERQMIETVSYLPGATTNYPLRGVFRSDKALDSAAQLLRQLHDATTNFRCGDLDTWYLEPRYPREVICHGDYAPYNCTFDECGTVTGVFDFDTAHPGPRNWDIAYAAYRWVPLTTAESDAIDPSEQRRRFQRFCATYGTGEFDEIVTVAIDRLHSLVDHMRSQASAGHTAFQRHITDGHDLLYLRDAAYLRVHRADLARLVPGQPEHLP